MRRFAEVYPLFGQPVSRERCELFLELTDDIDVELLDRAMVQAARVCERFPTPAEVRRIAGELRGAMQAEATERSRRRTAECSACGGCGWVFFDGEDGVRRCSCRQATEVVH